MSMLDDLYKPDYKSKLTSQIVGRPGSGKSKPKLETKEIEEVDVEDVDA